MTKSVPMDEEALERITRDFPVLTFYSHTVIPPTLYCAGGYIRDTLLGKSPKDADFYSESIPFQINEYFLYHVSKDNRVGTWKSKKTPPEIEVQVIQVKNPPEFILTRFDYTVDCAYVYWDESSQRYKGFAHPNWKEDLQAKQLRLVNRDNLRSKNAVQRLLKHVRLGFEASNELIADVIAAVVTGGSKLLFSEDELRKNLLEMWTPKEEKKEVQGTAQWGAFNVMNPVQVEPIRWRPMPMDVRFIEPDNEGPTRPAPGPPVEYVEYTEEFLGPAPEQAVEFVENIRRDNEHVAIAPEPLVATDWTPAVGAPREDGF